jgi:hypothetical protein
VNNIFYTSFLSDFVPNQKKESGNNFSDKITPFSGRKFVRPLYVNEKQPLMPIWFCQ